MEYIREIEVIIKKDTNKETTKIVLVLGEHNEDETVEQFNKMVKECLDEMLLGE